MYQFWGSEMHKDRNCIFSPICSHEMWFQPGCLWPVLTHLQLTSVTAELTVEFHSGGGFIHQVTCQLQKSCSWSLSKDQLCYISTSVPNTVYGVKVGTFGALKHKTACLRCSGVLLCSSGKEVTEANVFATFIAAGGNSTVVVTFGLWVQVAEPSVVFFSELKEERTTRATPEKIYDREDRWQYFKSL